MKERKTQNSNSTTRTVDREYYAHPETNRNKWFSYTDPYYTGNGSQTNENQENLQHQNSEQSSSQTNYYTGDNQNTENCNSCQNEYGNHKQEGSTTNYSQYAKQNQYSSDTQDTNLNAWENTSAPEPFVDTENHTNFNTSPRFAGDNNYYDSFTRTEQNANTCKCDQSYSSDYNQDNEGNFSHTHQYDCDKSCSNSSSQDSHDKSKSKSSQKDNKGGKV